MGIKDIATSILGIKVEIINPKADPDNHAITLITRASGNLYQ